MTFAATVLTLYPEMFPGPLGLSLAGRALEGVHRTDLRVIHAPKSLPADQCSTGEQKALLIGLVLAHADLVRHRHGGVAPILLLDEIGAHLDHARRSALFEEIVVLGSQRRNGPAAPAAIRQPRDENHVVILGLVPRIHRSTGYPRGWLDGRAKPDHDNASDSAYRGAGERKISAMRPGR